MLDSVELSDLIARLGVQGKSSIAFVIGGSLGLSDAGDVILVMDKNKDQEIKHLLNDLNENVDYGSYI